MSHLTRSDLNFIVDLQNLKKSIERLVIKWILNYRTSRDDRIDDSSPWISYFIYVCFLELSLTLGALASIHLFPSSFLFYLIVMEISFRSWQMFFITFSIFSFIALRFNVQTFTNNKQILYLFSSLRTQNELNRVWSKKKEQDGKTWKERKGNYPLPDGESDSEWDDKKKTKKLILCWSISAISILLNAKRCLIW